jgi:hypothetical protein
MEHHALHVVKVLWEDLPPLRKKKNPFIAAFAGFFFGGIGLGIYFQSWKDAVYPILGLVLLSIAFPAIGTVTALILTAVWGFARAANSD